MKSASYEIGAWVFSKTGKLIKIVAHDMPDLQYEDIERDAEPHEIPEFEVANANEIDVLAKENFFNELMKRCPYAFGEFLKWIDVYKKQEFYLQDFERPFNWDMLFLNHSPTEQKIKFHHLPFEMQFGILVDFFSDQVGYCSFSIAIDNWQERDIVIDWIIDHFVFMELQERNKDKE